MEYKNTLKSYLKFEKELKDEEKIIKEFSFEFPVIESDSKKIDIDKKTESGSEIAESKKYDLSNTKYLNAQNIASYIQVNYLDKDRIEKGKLINDLIVLKNYINKIKVDLDIEKFIVSGITIFVAVITIVISEAHELGAWILLLLVILFVILYIRRTNKKSDLNKLKIINNGIFILEALKDEMVKENKISDTRNFEDNGDNLVAEKSEPSNYLNSDNDILYDEINEGTLEDKNKYIEKNFNLSECLLDENNTTKIKSNLHSRKEMRIDKSLALNFAKKEHENSLVNKASKISFLILFLFSINKKLNDKK